MLPLLGRSTTVARIIDLLDNGKGVVVEGPAGVGKTSVIREVTLRLQRDSEFSIVGVSATLASQPIPLGALAGQLVGASPGADDLARVQEALIRRANGADLLIAVDDGHLLDDVSAVAIHQLVVSGHARVLASAREGAASSAAFSALADEGSSIRLVLDPLDETEVADMVTALLAGPIDARLARAAWAATRGIPLAVSLMVESGLRSGTVVQHHGLWTLTGPLSAEPRLLTLIVDQLDQLSGPERSAVEMIALAEPLEAFVVRRLVESDVIVSLLDRGLVVDSEYGVDSQLRLIHPLFGEAVRRTITDVRRRTAISALAEALDVSHESEAEMLLRVAVWGTAARSELDPDLLVRAAAVARGRSTNSAVRLLRAALEAGAPASVALDLAMLLTWAGRNDEAAKVLADLDTEGLTPLERASICATRAFGLIWTIQRPDVALTILAEERAISMVHRELPDLLDGIEAAAYLVGGDVVSAERIGSEVLARPEIDVEASLHAATTSVVALGYSGRIVQAISVAQQWKPTETPARATDSPMASGLAAAYWEMLELDGDLATLQLEAGRARRTAVLEGDDLVAGRAAKHLGRAALYGARPHAATRLTRECLVALGEFDRMFIAWCRAQLVEALAIAGETVEARQVLAQTQQQSPIAPIWASHQVLAEAAVLASEGQHSRAAEIAARGADEAYARGMAGQAMRCWYDAMRFGHTGARRQLIALEVEGKLATACRAHASALLAGDGEGLDRAALTFSSLGIRLYAAEVSVSAAAEHLRSGNPERAAVSSEHARSQLDSSEPVVTPLLQFAPRMAVELSPREREVSRMASSGLSDRAIADCLHLSVRTVESHLASAYSKLGLEGRRDLTAVFAGPLPT